MTMAYTLQHTVWFSNRGKCGTSLLGVTPSSKFMFSDTELESYTDSAALMSGALLKLTDQITQKSATLVAMKHSDESYTDGKNIVVGMGPLYEHDDKNEGMDILMGLACHEACHCAYTDFSDATLDAVMKYKIGKWLSNLYEDECIEEMMIIENRQLAFFLDAVRSHYFSLEKMEKEMKKASLSKSKLAIVQLMLMILVRKPDLIEYVDSEWIDEFGPMLDEIYDNVIVNMNVPRCFEYTPTSVVNKATIDTIEIMKKHLSDDEMQDNVDMSKGMLGNSTSEVSSHKQFGDGKSNAQRMRENRAARKKSDDIVASKMKEGINQAKSEGDITDAPGELFESGAKSIGAAKSNDADKQKYDILKARMRREISVAKKIIIPNEKKIENEMDNFHRNGQIISSHLVQAIQGVNCVYQRRVQKTSKDNANPKYAVVLAIDESASMTSPSVADPSLSSHDIATMLAITFYEAMREYPGIEVYIYGHGDNIVKYATPKDNKPYRLATRSCQLSQNESISYEAIYKDVRLQTSKPILFFNITDCNYLASQDKIENIVDEMRMKNCIVSLMSILGKRTIKRNTEKVSAFNDRIYGNGQWIQINEATSIEEGLKNLAKIFRNNLDRYRK